MSAPEPYWSDDMVTLHLGDCREVLAAIEENSIDAVVCDPPYGLEFMGAEWDSFKTGDGFRRSRNPADAGRDKKPSNARIRQPSDRDKRPGAAHNSSTSLVARNVPDAYVAGQPFQAWCQQWAEECLRVLKPGGWMLAFGSTRTSHRLKCGIEDAGFEIRDTVAELTGQDAPEMMWVYGSGMVKSRDAARSVDMQVCTLPGRHCMRRVPDDPKPGDHVCPESAEGESWRGYGTAVSPAWEPIVVARKLLAGTLGANLLTFGTGALNIDGCRVGSGGYDAPGDRGHEDNRSRAMAFGMTAGRSHDAGRWPSNVVLVHSPSCQPTGMRRVRGTAGGTTRDGIGVLKHGGMNARPQHAGIGGETIRPGYGDADGMETVEAWDCAPGCPVAEMDRQSGVLTSGANPARRGSDKFRDAYGEFAGQQECVSHRGANAGGASRFFATFHYAAKAPASERPKLPDGTAWPTVKPLRLMRHLVRLVTPPGGTVLDLFCGTGVTGEAAVVEGFRCILIDKDPVAAELTKVRLRKPIQPALFGLEAS
jgi:DNA modification methylase